MKSNKAFTLIELLVVVLIIGILVAIAVPKYQLAVEKTEFRKYQTMAQGLEAAYDEYYLANNKAPLYFSDLSITMPQDFSVSKTLKPYYQCMSNSEMFCCISPSKTDGSGIINCGKSDLSVIYQKNYFKRSYIPANRKGYCLAKIDNIRANKLCSYIGKTAHQENAYTYKGHNNNYTYYKLY